MRGFKIFFGVLFVGFILVVCLSGSASAYTKNIVMESFQQTSGLTGEIYYHWTTPSTPSSYSYCVDHDTNMQVTNTAYYAEKVSIAGNEGLLEAAYLMDKYAYSKQGVQPSFSAAQTGAIVQLAIWAVIENTTISGTGSLYDVARNLKLEAEALGLAELAYLANKYVLLDVYNDSSKTTLYQDVLTPVPIPGAAWLLGAGLIGLAGIRRRMQA